MTFGHPGLAALTLLIPVAIGLSVYAHRRRAHVLAVVFSPAALQALVPPGLGRARALQGGFGVLAATGLVLASLGPQFGFEWVQRQAKGIDIVVILDVSRSMDAADVTPSRMEWARRELRDLVEQLRGDSVGLVLVANGAYTRLPLTTDYGTFLWAVGESATGTIQAQGTSMSAGVDTAVKMLERAGASGKGIVVVSDGEFHDQDAELDAALASASSAGIPVYTLGVGEESGAPIPLAEGGFKKDHSGNVVMSRLTPDALRHLASATGGAYVQAVVGDDDVRGIYTELRSRLTADERSVEREQIPFERYQWPLGLAWLALTLSAWFGVGPRVKLRSVARVLPWLLVLGISQPAFAGPREDGLTAAKAKDWPVAIDKLGQARVESPQDVVVGQALGEALYRAGRYREAEQVFQSLSTTDTSHRAVHAYNAGNAAYRDGRLEDAVAHFGEAEKADPQLTSAAKNGAAVQKEIALREKPKDPNSGDKGEDQGQDSGKQAGAGQDGQPPGDGQQAEGQPAEGGEQSSDGSNRQGSEGQQAPKGQPSEQQGQGEPQAQGGEPGDASEQKPGSSGDPGAATAESGDTGEASSAAASGEQGDTDKLSPAAAARLLDSVKDGTPRTGVSGPSTEKDW